MPIRNPFARRPSAAVAHHDETVARERETRQAGFERVETIGSKASSGLSIRSAKSRDTGEYKMSVVNDSGIYLPPSPTEAKAHGPRKYLSSSRASSDTRSSLGDIEPFSISRESFDSYRRSFDISARSPVVKGDFPTRQSLDSTARFPRLARSAMDRSVSLPPPTAEEGFEDVGLDDHKQQPRKRNFFSKFGDAPDKDSTAGVSRFLIPGRKRGQSGQGSELGNMERPKPSDEAR